jgi:hypothetical protein
MEKLVNKNATNPKIVFPWRLCEKSIKISTIPPDFQT